MRDRFDWRRKTRGIGFILLLAFAGAAAAKTVRVVVLRSKDLPAYNEAVEGFRKTLSARSPGATVETMTLPDDFGASETLVENIFRTSPDLVLAVGGPAAQRAREKERSAPVVFCMALASENNLPYGGVVLDIPIADYVAQIHRALPDVKTVGFIYNPEGSPALIREVRALEGKGGLSIYPASSPAEVDRAMLTFKQKADCLFLWPDPVIFPINSISLFLKDAYEKGVPVVGVSPSFVKAGAVAAFFPDYGNNGELAAHLSMKALAGQPIDKLPVQTPSKIKASFNLPIARRLNIRIDDKTAASAVDVVR